MPADHPTRTPRNLGLQFLELATKLRDLAEHLDDVEAIDPQAGTHLRDAAAGLDQCSWRCL